MRQSRDYGFDASGAGLSLVGAKLSPPWPDTTPLGMRYIKGDVGTCTLREASALAHYASGCIDAPMDPSCVTWWRKPE